MLPGLSVLAIICIVLLLALVLDRGLFRPIVRVMEEREATIRAATELAEASAARAEAATEEFERRTRAAQAEVYKAMDERRRAALDHRATLLAQTRQDVERTLAEASASLEAQLSEARARLDEEADTLADAVVDRVLGRKAS